MLHEQTVQKLFAMKLGGMVEAYEEQSTQSAAGELSFDERFGMLVDRQWICKENRALTTRLKYAKLKEPACIEDLDFRAQRGLKRPVINHLASCDWITHHQNCIITGSTGVGKTFVACALAHQVCREGYRAIYFYAPKLFRGLSKAEADGSLARLLTRIAKANLLVVDDWGLGEPEPRHYQQFLEILEDRHGFGSTLITSQFPLNTWHEMIQDATVADAILDRLIHNAHRIELDGDSMRKKKKKGNGSEK